MALVVEILNSTRRVVQRHMFHADAITIGRDYKCDVVLDDLHVDPEHAVLSMLENDRFLLEDQSTLNGIRNGKKKRMGAQFEFGGREEIVLGETRLRIVDATQPLPDTLKIKDDDSLRKLVNHPGVAVLSFLLANLIAFYQLYIENVTKVELVKYVQHLAWFSLGIVGLALLVSFVGKVFRREWRFIFILFFLSFVSILEELGNFLLGVLAFNVYVVKNQWLIDGIWTSILFALMAWALGYCAFKIKLIYQRLLVVCVGLATLGLTSLPHIYNDFPKYLRRPPMTKVFMSPTYQFSQAKSDEAFLDRAQSVFDIDVSEE